MKKQLERCWKAFEDLTSRVGQVWNQWTDTRDSRSTSSKSKQHLASPRLTMQEGIDRSQLHSDTFTAATCTCAFFVWDESLWLDDRARVVSKAYDADSLRSFPILPATGWKAASWNAFKPDFCSRTLCFWPWSSIMNRFLFLYFFLTLYIYIYIYMFSSLEVDDVVLSFS